MDAHAEDVFMGSLAYVNEFCALPPLVDDADVTPVTHYEALLLDDLVLPLALPCATKAEPLPADDPLPEQLLQYDAQDAQTVPGSTRVVPLSPASSPARELVARVPSGREQRRTTPYRRQRAQPADEDDNDDDDAVQTRAHAKGLRERKTAILAVASVHRDSAVDLLDQLVDFQLRAVVEWAFQLVQGDKPEKSSRVKGALRAVARLSIAASRLRVDRACAVQAVLLALAQPRSVRLASKVHNFRLPFAALGMDVPSAASADERWRALIGPQTEARLRQHLVQRVCMGNWDECFA